MKNILLIVFVTALVSSFFGPIESIQAAPMGAGQHPGDYFFGDEDLGRWMIGAYYLNRKRDITTRGVLRPMENTKTMGYAGYQVMYGMGAYLIAGSTKTQFEGLRQTDTSPEFGFGLQFNILDHEVPDPLLIEDRLRINANIQYTQCSADWIATSVDWEEIYGTLTLGFVNDIEGNKYFHFNSIGFFFGAVYSDLRSSSIKADSQLGYITGVEFYLTEKTSFEFGSESLDQGSIFAAFHISL